MLRTWKGFILQKKKLAISIFVRDGILSIADYNSSGMCVVGVVGVVGVVVTTFPDGIT